jgi:uncharacterized membrane protein YqgA involved in biofilm formation
MKNLKTPRTLAECSFEVGYQEGQMNSIQSRIDAFLSVLLACAIGIGFGVCYVVWWAQ